MSGIIEIAAAVGVFLVGILVRALLAVLMILLFAIPVVLVVAAIRGWQELRARSLGLVPAGGLHYKPGLLYAANHTWLARDPGRMLRVGLDDLAQRLFPGVTSIRLVAPGTTVREGDPLAEISCGDKKASIGSPADAVVVDQNDAVLSDPSLVHRDPYRAGWLLRLQPVNRRYALAARRGKIAQGWLSEESFRLTGFLERELGIAAADGGEVLVPSAALLRADQWKALTQTFLNGGANEPRAAA